MNPTTDLWDWRRRIADLYAAIRGEPDPLAGWHRRRETRGHLFATHPQSPIEDRAAYVGIPLFPHDPALRFAVALDPFEAAAEEYPAGQDGTVRMRPFARTHGLAGPLGGELTLFWVEGYGGGVFLPFTDATCGRESFGGGRYLLDTIKSADLGRDSEGRLVLDFNFAYNPSCAYSDRWICPLPPPQNRLPAAVRAGERKP